MALAAWKIKLKALFNWFFLPEKQLVNGLVEKRDTAI